jgi:predicted transcriptional regulator
MAPRRRRNLAEVLGPLEMSVMEIVWDRGRVTVRDVHDVLRRSRAIAYTTVMTTLGRLADKGLLNRIEGQPAHHFVPAVSREQYARSTVSSVMGWLMNHFPDPVVGYLLEKVEDEDEDVLDRLREAIERRSNQAE